MAFCIALVVGGDGLGLARQLEEGGRQMAVARGVLLQVVLVVVLGGIEIAQREMLHGEGSPTARCWSARTWSMVAESASST